MKSARVRANELMDACVDYNSDRTIAWFNQEKLRVRLIELFEELDEHKEKKNG